jgi:hypothetical protein
VAGTGLARGAETGPYKVNNVSVHDLTVEGGNYGLDTSHVYVAGKEFYYIVLRNQMVAGVMAGNESLTEGCGEANVAQALTSPDLR